MASKAFYDGVSVDHIMQACQGKAHKTLSNFHLKDLTWSDNDNNIYLGAVVAAQQFLDPSPQTIHPRKEYNVLCVYSGDPDNLIVNYVSSLVASNEISNPRLVIIGSETLGVTYLKIQTSR